jgi:serine/threonine protein kinase
MNQETNDPLPSLPAADSPQKIRCVESGERFDSFGHGVQFLDPPVSQSSDLRGLFRKALELDPAGRAQLLTDPAFAPELRAELEAMLAADAGADTFLKATVASEQPDFAGIGQRFGPYETRALLGHGGMGVVFQADRVDGELSQSVAIKVVRDAWLAPRSLERFRNERQTLAALVHPNIARLLDGGTRSDGVAYLVMELVDGLPIDRYCEHHHLSIAERLRLVLPICDAIDTAHRKLIVHRDLKPSNILVTPQGEPKLLDFGIAKTLDPGGDKETRTLAFTPDFASPEQARGEEITTATDIYGLGAVLYLLLAGKAPGQAPESLSKLPGDLRNILLTALHADPVRRYRTARDLADDLRRYLDHRPVEATADSLRYRLRRFVQRNRFASAAGAMAIIAIVAGTAASLYQARRAQQRFTQVRTLANHFIFDFEDAISRTPGNLNAQKLVASTAREYLASLLADSKSDRGLAGDLAEAYSRLAVIERGLGNFKEELNDLNQSLTILTSVERACCSDPRLKSVYLQDLSRLVETQAGSGSLVEGGRVALQAVQAARLWVQSAPTEPLAAKSLRDALKSQGYLQGAMGQHQNALDSLSEAVRITDLFIDQHPNDDVAKQDAVNAREYLAGELEAVGRIQEALDRVIEGEAMEDELLAQTPGDRNRQRVRIRLTSLQGRLVAHLPDAQDHREESVRIARHAYELAYTLSQKSPGDLQQLDLAAVMAGRLANRLDDNHQNSEALSIQRQASVLMRQLLDADPGNRRTQYLFANNQAAIADILMHFARWGEARESLSGAEKYVQSSLAQTPNDVPTLKAKTTIEILIARVERNLGHLPEARKRCQDAFGSAQDLIRLNRNAKHPVDSIGILHSEAKLLGVPDPLFGIN